VTVELQLQRWSASDLCYISLCRDTF